MTRRSADGDPAATAAGSSRPRTRGDDSAGEASHARAAGDRPVEERSRSRAVGDDAVADRSTFTVDLHAHTRFFHGFEARATAYDPVGARLLGRAVDRAGLDGVALTNHDYYRPFDVGAAVVGVPGIEISTTAGHVLVVGPDPPGRTEPETLSPAAAVELAHERDCAAIVPHPFRRGTVRESDAPFDAVELNGKHPRVRERVRQLATDLDLPIVGGSDAHYPFEAGRTYTRIEADELTPVAVVEAIREGRVSPAVRERPLDQLVRRGYGLVHEYKARPGR